MTNDRCFTALQRALDARGEAEHPVRLWWRDDDAIEPTPALDRLIGFELPVGLAVIPALVSPALADRIEGRTIAVLQHGWAHINHEPPGSKPAELGAAREPSAVLRELADGQSRLRALFGARFVPILVPPWNRITEAIATRSTEFGYSAVSTFAEAPAPTTCAYVQTDLDPIAWKRGRSFIGDDASIAWLLELLARKDAAPIGLLTHHLVHGEDLWRFLDRLVAVTRRHPAVQWLSPVQALAAQTP